MREDNESSSSMVPSTLEICCIGAGFVGGPHMAMLAYKCPDITVSVVDIDSKRVAAWNSDKPPIFEPGLDEILGLVRDRNLFFSTDVKGGIYKADIIFMCLPTPTKSTGLGAGFAPDLKYIENSARQIADVADSGKIVVEKSTVPVRTAESIRRILNANDRSARFQVLSNPEFLAEGTAIADLENPDRVLIGGDKSIEGIQAMGKLVEIYAKWVPRKRIITTNLWSSELSKLTANAFLAQRLSSINSISMLCEETGANVDEVAEAVGADSRIGAKFLKSSVGFGGSCFEKDILNLIYLCESSGLSEVAEYWRQVVVMNSLQRRRFSSRIVNQLSNSVSGKRIAILGFSFKKDTNDIRESAATYVCRDLLEEEASLSIYDPQASSDDIKNALGIIRSGAGLRDKIETVSDPYQACYGAQAVAVLTEWDEFKELDFKRIFNSMRKPAFLFDGRNILDLNDIEEIGFQAFGIGRSTEKA